MIQSRKNLIFDVGSHNGNDTDFYLAKGFSVVAIDANPQMCELLSHRFSREVLEGRLFVINGAIADVAGDVRLYRNLTNDQFTTANVDWVERNIHLGTTSEELLVPSVQLEAVVRQYGVPYYAKIDIEGSDIIALRSFGTIEERPKFVSIKSSKTSLSAVIAELRLLTSLGYRRFKVVPQHKVSDQVPPTPAREGVLVKFDFPRASSGLFGEEAPGRWEGFCVTILRYALIHLRYRLVGDAARRRNATLTRCIRAVVGKAGWYDTHAKS